MYAVIESCGRQYRVKAGEVVEFDRLPGDASSAVEFDKVLALVDGDQVQVGAPLVANAKVTGEVVEHFRGKKLVVFKMKRRKGYHKLHGHRSALTRVRITGITTG